MQENYTKEEQELLARHHPVVGSRILSDIPDFEDVANMIKHHHEAVSGDGFPGGLIGEDIPLGARIIAVIDAYDRLLHPYDKGPERKLDKVVELMRSRSGVDLDKELVEVFLTKVLPATAVTDKMAFRIFQLMPGMVLAENIVNKEGTVIFPAGKTINKPMVDDMANVESLNPLTTRVWVTRESVEKIQREIDMGKIIDPGLKLMHQHRDDKAGRPAADGKRSRKRGR